MSVLVAGVPLMPYWVGVILTSHVPAYLKRIVHFAVRFLVFLLIVILQVPRADRVVLLVAVILYVTPAVAVKLPLIGSLVVRVPRTQRTGLGVRGGGRGVKVAVVVRASIMETVQVLVPVQAPLQPANVELAVGVAVRVTVVSSSKTVEQVAVHATPLGSELIEPVPAPALIVVNDQAVSNGVAIHATPLDRLPAGARVV